MGAKAWVALLTLGLLLLSTSASTAQVASYPSTEINWQGVGAAIPPRNASAIRYNMADSAVLQLPDGTLRMYYGNFTEPADQYNVLSAGTIDSAVSKDGIHWTVEPGTRIDTPHYCPPAVNSVFRLANGTIRLYTGCGNVYDSNDGLSFVQLSRTVQPPQVAGSQGPGSYTIVPLASGKYRMYMDQTFNGTDPRYTVVKVYSYLSSDGFSFVQEGGVRLGSPLQYGDSVIRSRGHPLVYLLANGTWIMYFDTATVAPPISPWPGDPSVTANPVGVAISKDGLNWNVTRPTFVESGESYQATTAPSGARAMVFGFYGSPQFPLPSYATYYGGGLYYAVPFYHIIVNGRSYPASITTNSTISSWRFSGGSREMLLNVTASTPSSLRLSFPSAVLSGSLNVTVDGAPVNGAVSQNESDYAVYLNYPAGTHVIIVDGTQAVPEFPLSPTIPLAAVLLAATMLLWGVRRPRAMTPA